MSDQVLIEYRPSLFFPPRSGPWLVGKITFVPGVKNYPLDDWKEIESNEKIWAIISNAMETGIVRVISKSTSEIETPQLPKSQQEAIDLVKKTFSLTLLKQWQEIEKRKPVLEAIALQLNLEVDKKAKDEKSEKPVTV
jgi:hypothetical protein